MPGACSGETPGADPDSPALDEAFKPLRPGHCPRGLDRDPGGGTEVTSIPWSKQDEGLSRPREGQRGQLMAEWEVGLGPWAGQSWGTYNFIVQTRTHFERMGDTKNHFNYQLFEQTKSFYGNDGSIKQLYSKKNLF